jgi:molybdopterin converting factor small subunit
MRVEILLFGPLASLAGENRLVVEAPGGTLTCGVLREAVAAAHPSLASPLRLHRFAVNQELVDDAAPVREGDEVALIGMVSGG